MTLHRCCIFSDIGHVCIFPMQQQSCQLKFAFLNGSIIICKTYTLSGLLLCLNYTTLINTLINVHLVHFAAAMHESLIYHFHFYSLKTQLVMPIWYHQKRISSTPTRLGTLITATLDSLRKGIYFQALIDLMKLTKDLPLPWLTLFHKENHLTMVGGTAWRDVLNAFWINTALTTITKKKAL